MDNSENRRTLGAILILVAILAGLIIWSEGSNQTAVDRNQAEKLREISYQGQEGRTVLDLLKSEHAVETKAFSGLGEFVTVIDGQPSGDAHFWAYYVNGQMGQIGADQYQTKSTEQISWKLEAIN